MKTRTLLTLSGAILLAGCAVETGPATYYPGYATAAPTYYATPTAYQPTTYTTYNYAPVDPVNPNPHHGFQTYPYPPWSFDAAPDDAQNGGSNK